ncbi:organelle RRM domain-containing protein 6, chloroplastic-like isoform X3 [Papaver somniferum]|uniref:organelle RRM domain-containing protein 6, chloroplastic-like isoform X3 n=1 Tax=Papaver somniferum TaxID=3469 RepID=UPI000E6FA55F|nr:organelle RRM domain-containing protein 6, chloroplastic-like isoform X3 [Papaver somniferum]
MAATVLTVALPVSSSITERLKDVSCFSSVSFSFSSVWLSFRTTEESLRNAFQNFGELVEVNLVMDKVANRPRGFAFLRYSAEEESKKAIEGMHGKVWVVE